MRRNPLASLVLLGFLLVAVAVSASGQITGLTTFTAGQVANPDHVNANFAALANAALNRTGGTVTGNIAASAGVTFDGIDIGAALCPTCAATFLSVSDSVGSLATVRAGGISMASQAQYDVFYAASATQHARLANGSTGDTLTANTGGAPTWEGTPRALAFATAAQAVLTGATDALTLDSETFDVTGWHSTSVNTNRLTVPAGGGGVYLVLAHTVVSQSAAAVTGAVLHLTVDGTTVRRARVNMTDAAGADLVTLTIEHLVTLTAGQYVSLAGEAVSSGASFGSTDGTLGTRLSVVRLVKQ